VRPPTQMEASASSSVQFADALSEAPNVGPGMVLGVDIVCPAALIQSCAVQRCNWENGSWLRLFQIFTSTNANVRVVEMCAGEGRPRHGAFI
jgi:hypothetical protein